MGEKGFGQIQFTEKKLFRNNHWHGREGVQLNFLIMLSFFGSIDSWKGKKLSFCFIYYSKILYLAVFYRLFQGLLSLGTSSFRKTSPTTQSRWYSYIFFIHYRYFQFFQLFLLFFQFHKDMFQFGIHIS